MSINIEQLVNETVESYYDYALKLEGGCNYIINAFQSGNVAEATASIQALGEGLAWMVDAEGLLALHSLEINSPIQQITPLFEKINNALAAENFEVVTSLFDQELKPLFKNVQDWQFTEVIS